MVLGFGTHRRGAHRAGVTGGEVGLADDRGVSDGRVGAEGEQVDELAGVATGGVGLVEDAVFPDGGRVEVGADGQPYPPMADGCVEVTCGSVVQEEVLVERFRPAVVAVVEVGGQPASDRCGEYDDAAVDMQASVDEIGDPKALDVSGAQAVESDQATTAARATSSDSRAARILSTSIGSGCRDSCSPVLCARVGSTSVSCSP